MFDSLKKKLAGWLGSTAKEDKTEKKTEKELVKDIEEKEEAVKKKSSKKADVTFKKKVKSKASGKLRGEVIDELEEGLAEEEEKLEEKKAAELVEEKKEEKRGFFSKLKSAFTSQKVTQDYFDTHFDELEMILLENNVAMLAVDSIKETMKGKILGREFKKSEIESKMREALKETISSLLIEPKVDMIEYIKKSPSTVVILFCGINGSGKTTSLAKMANLLKKNNISCIFAAADTFRAASIEQLAIHGSKLGVSIIKQTYGSDPAAVAFDAIKYAHAKKIKVVLIDTAGRMHTKQNLMEEISKIVRVANPDFKIFVGESITGNDATEQARIFNESVNIDGIILTKADIDEKGGTAISVSKVTGKPIFYLGTGQEYGHFEKFDKSTILEALGL